MKPDAADNSVPREISALLSNERLILRETQRAVTPLGGVAVFVAFLHKVGFVEKLRQHMPIHWKSSNYIDPNATFTAFLLAVFRSGRGCGFFSFPSQGGVCGEASAAHADPLEVLQLHRSQRHLHRISYGRIGGSQTFCSRQLVTQRSRLACLAGPVPLSHCRHHPQSVPTFWPERRASSLRPAG